MKKILNLILCFFKYILFIVAFSITLYIMIMMCNRLDKNYVDVVYLFIPYLLIFLLFLLNLCLKNSYVNNNIFYNITCCLVFIVNIFISYRCIFDKSMLLNRVYGYSINFGYFNDYLSFNKIMLYGLIIATIFFMFSYSRKD